MLMVGLEQKLLSGSVQWTLHPQRWDHKMLKPVAMQKDRVSETGRLADARPSILGGHLGREPRRDPAAHLTLKDPMVAVNVSLQTCAGPERRYRVAGLNRVC